MATIRGKRSKDSQGERMLVPSAGNLQITSMKQESRERKYNKRGSKDKIGLGGMGLWVLGTVLGVDMSMMWSHCMF